jgi:RNA polymerase sigma factor (sigma-70 family)
MQPSRKRIRSALAGLVCAAAMSQDTVTGFSNPTPSFFSPRSTAAASTLLATPLRAVQRIKFDSPRVPPVNLPRLTHEEQMELLSHTVELRRIKETDAEVNITSKKTTALSPLISVRAEAAGFGDDIDAFERAIDLGHKARETLVTRNIGLVYFCLNEIIGKRQSNGNQRGGLQSLSREDLVQEGAIGLARAVDRWNPEIGGKFSTYAVYWVRAAIFRCVAERDDLMRVPEHVSAAVRKVSKAAKRLGLEIDGDNIISAVYSSSDANWKEAHAAKALAEEAGLTPKQLTAAMRVRDRRSRGIMSYDGWMQQGRDFEVDLSPVTENDPSLSTIETEHLRVALSRFLRPREMEALSWRYGLTSEVAAKPSNTRDYVSEAEDHLFGKSSQQELPVQGRWGEAMSFVEVGKKMEVSAEYGRRLCHAALDKLRRAAEEGALEPALLV